jgi:hypothetical protein
MKNGREYFCAGLFPDKRPGFIPMKPEDGEEFRNRYIFRVGTWNIAAFRLQDCQYTKDLDESKSLDSTSKPAIAPKAFYLPLFMFWQIQSKA